MCLNTVDEEIQHYTEGYKIFRKRSGGLVGEMYHGVGVPAYQINEWIIDNNLFSIYSTLGGTYESGFHFFVNLRGAEAWIQDSPYEGSVFKVEVRNCVASGTQIVTTRYPAVDESYSVGVAREMKIIKEVTE